MISVNTCAPLPVILCVTTFYLLLVIDHFQEPSPEEFDSWADEITRYETE